MIEKLPRVPQDIIDDNFGIVNPKGLDNVHAKINEIIDVVNKLELKSMTDTERQEYLSRQ